MNSATPPTTCQIIYRSLLPEIGDDIGQNLCYLCGGITKSGVRVADWIGDGFNDFARAACPASKVVCSACCHVTSRVTPVPGRPPGKCSCCEGTLKILHPRKSHKEKTGAPCTKCEGTGLNEHGGSWRSYSHWYDQLGYGNASKAEKPAIREFLNRDHVGWWCLAIAVSGQKHVLPFAPLNYGGRSGLVAVESDVVHVPDDLGLVRDMISLLTAGALKSEVESGEYGQRTWRECELQTRTFEQQWGGHRGNGWFALAIWLAQREEAEDGTEKRKAAAGRDRVVPRCAQQGLRRDARASTPKALDKTTGSVGSKSDGSGEHGAVAGGGPIPSPHCRTEQLALFGAGEPRPSGRRRWG